MNSNIENVIMQSIEKLDKEEILISCSPLFFGCFTQLIKVNIEIGREIKIEIIISP